MDTQEFKKMVLKLGEMSSKHAADWLVLTYPVGSAGYGSAIALITHRSWKRSDQIRLAKHYLSKLPFASARVYEAFLSFMAISIFLNVIKEFLPNDDSDMDLLLYHLQPSLERAAKTASDRELVRAFISGAR
jgi:hypothetical protein